MPTALGDVPLDAIWNAEDAKRFREQYHPVRPSTSLYPHKPPKMTRGTAAILEALRQFDEPLDLYGFDNVAQGLKEYRSVIFPDRTGVSGHDCWAESRMLHDEIKRQGAEVRWV